MTSTPTTGPAEASTKTPAAVPDLQADRLDKQKDLDHSLAELRNLEENPPADTATDAEKLAYRNAVQKQYDKCQQLDNELAGVAAKQAREAGSQYVTKAAGKKAAIVAGAVAVLLGGGVGFNAMTKDSSSEAKAREGRILDAINGKNASSGKPSQKTPDAGTGNTADATPTGDASGKKLSPAEATRLANLALKAKGQVGANPVNDPGTDKQPCPAPLDCPEGKKPGCVDDGSTKKRVPRKNTRRKSRRRRAVVTPKEVKCADRDLRPVCLDKRISANTATGEKNKVDIKANTDKLSVHERALRLLGRTQDGVSARLSKVLQGPDTRVKGRPAQNPPKNGNKGSRGRN